MKEEVTLFKILDDLHKMYAQHDTLTIEAKRISFAQPPDMDDHVDDYFTRQEDCKRIAAGLRRPITEADMVSMLVEHMGATGTHTKATGKFNNLDNVEQTWAKTKS